MAEELDVRPVQRPGALADPREVRRGVVGEPGARVDPGHGPLVLKQQGLVAGVELDRAELGRIGPAGVHEGQRAVDLAGQGLVPPPCRAGRHEVGVPRVHLAQVGVAALGERTAQVERGRRVVAGAQHPLRVRGP